LFELFRTDGAASTESSLLELCRVVTEVDDHQSRAKSPIVEYLIEIQQTIL